MENVGWIAKPKRSNQPIGGALTVFTDAGRRSRTATITWKDGEQWNHQILQAQPQDSLQTLELFAVVWAFIHWKEVPLNVVSDSLYVVGVAQRIEDAMLRDLKNQRLTELLV
ncbi:PO113 protein, partial [Corythaixoides concolor]|nr:PO113 protein [Corythaixoides concolor]